MQVRMHECMLVFFSLCVVFVCLSISICNSLCVWIRMYVRLTGCLSVFMLFVCFYEHISILVCVCVYECLVCACASVFVQVYIFDHGSVCVCCCEHLSVHP